MSIKLDTNTIRSINAFEKITGTEVKDCIIDGNSAYFIVNEGKIGLVIGKNGRTIRRVQESINKKVRVFEYSDNLEQFIKNVISAPIEYIKIEKEPKRVIISVVKNKRSVVIGRDGRNIKVIGQFLKRNFGILEIKVQ